MHFRLLASILALSSLLPNEAESQTSRADSAGSRTPHRDCTLSGDAYVARNTPIYGKARGEEPIGVLTGMPVRITLSGLPSDPEGGRARIAVAPEAGVEMKGTVDPSKVDLFSRASIRVKPGVWIAPGSKLTYRNARHDALRVSVESQEAHAERFEAWARCEQLALNPLEAKPMAPPQNARPYLATKGEVQLLRRPSRSAAVLLSLHPTAWSDGLLFWGSEHKGGFRHVLYRDTLLAEGWVRDAKLTPLKGKVEPRPRTPTLHHYPDLKIAGAPRLFTTTTSLPLRLKASTESPEVGSIPAGFKVFVIDEVPGWVGVLPQSLSLVAPGGGQFWIPASQLGHSP